MDFDEMTVPYLARLVRSWGCVRALRRVAAHGPSTTHPHVTPSKLDTLQNMGLVSASGQVSARGRVVLRHIEVRR